LSDLKESAPEQLESLRHQIVANFGGGSKPRSDEVVLWDGFDQLEKESAVKFYAGKTWTDVLLHLQDLKNAALGGAYYLEEWSVLNREDALPYYLRAHLEYLLETLSSAEPNEEFMFFLIGQWYQVIYMYKGSPFNPEQTKLLQRVALFVADSANDERRFPFFNQDIGDQVKIFLGELQARG